MDRIAMTNEEIMAMKEGPEMNSAIAERIIEWTGVVTDKTGTHGRSPKFGLGADCTRLLNLHRYGVANS